MLYEVITISVAPIVDADVAVAEAPAKAAPKKEAAPVVEEAPKAEANGDDLTKLTGVGPKLAEILAEGGFATVITSYSIHYTKLYDAVSRCLANSIRSSGSSPPSSAI